MEGGGWRAEGGEGQSQGKFFPGWRAEADEKGSFYFPLGTPFIKCTHMNDK